MKAVHRGEAQRVGNLLERHAAFREQALGRQPLALLHQVGAELGFASL